MEGQKLHFYVSILPGQKSSLADIEAAIGVIELTLPLQNGGVEVYGPARAASTAEQDELVVRLHTEGKIGSSGGVQELYFQTLVLHHRERYTINSSHEGITDQSSMK
jgi:hypothetical protein